jgi:ABC-type transport system involved in multi-copper enzyme maturation permease subunit
MACWPIARTGLVLVFRRKLFLGLLGLALLNFLFLFAMIYLKAQIVAERPEIARFVNSVLSSVTGAGETYRDFMFAQGTVTMLVLVLAGAMLIGDDMRTGGLTFYLSRRISRWHYVVGKLLTIALMVSMTTTIPALVLYVEYGLLADSLGYFRENYRILLGILGYGLILAVVLGLLLFALAAWVQKTVPLVMCWAGVFVFLPVIGRILREVYGDRRWLLLVLWRDVRMLGSWCFGAVDPDRDGRLLGWSALIVLAVCVVSAAALVPRVRAVRVVS